MVSTRKMFLVQIKTPWKVTLLYLSGSPLKLKTPQFNCCYYLEHVQYVFRMSMWLWYLHFLLDVSVKRKWFQHHLSGLPFTSTKQHMPKLTKRYLSRPKEDKKRSHIPDVVLLGRYYAVWPRLSGKKPSQLLRGLAGK